MTTRTRFTATLLATGLGRAALGLGLALYLALSPALSRAFCRSASVPDTAPQAAAVASTCFRAGPAGRSHFLFWQSGCVPYSLNEAASPRRQITLEQATRLARSAFGEWTTARCAGDAAPSVSAVDVGPVACDRVEYDRSGPNANVIVFRDDAWPHDQLHDIALTTATFNVHDGEIFDMDTEIDSHDWDLVANLESKAVPLGAGGRIDLGWVLRHEAGHFLGLAHSAERESVMFASYQPWASVMSDDVAGICAIYPPALPSSTDLVEPESCHALPRHGFSRQCASERAEAREPAIMQAGSCAAVPGLGADRSALAMTLAVLVAWRVRRRVQRGQRARPALWALLLVFALVAALAPTHVQASVALEVGLDELLTGSDAVAIVVPLEQRSAWEDRRIVSYTLVEIADCIVGGLREPIWVRTLGGVVGDIGQQVEGEPSLMIGQPTLLFLKDGDDRYEVTDRAQGQFVLELDSNRRQRLAAARSAAALIPRASWAHGSVQPRETYERASLHGALLDDARSEIEARY